MQLRDCISFNGNSAGGYINNDGGTLTVRDVVVRNSLAKSNGGLEVGNPVVARATPTTQHNGHAVQRQRLSFSGLVVQNFGSSHTYVNNSVVWGKRSGTP